MAHNKKNFAVGLVATAPSPALSGTSLILYPGQGTRMPAVPFYLTVAPQGVLTTLDTAEVIEVTDVTDDTLTIVRAQKGTTAKEIGVDWLVSNGIYTEDLDEYELLLPETPVDPSLKFLNGNRTWSSIPTGATGFTGNVYYTTIASDVAGYYKLSYQAQPTETVLTGTVNNNEVLFRTYLYDEAVGVDSIDSGTWSTVSWAYVSGTTGITQLKLEVFVRHTNGTETTLFSDYSDDLNNTIRERLKDETTQPTYSVSPTDRIGVRVYGKTTANVNTTISTVIGDGDASYFTTPLRIRHTQLRDLNGDTSNVHVTTAEKTAITHTNRAALDNVAGTNTGDQVADGVTITGAGTIASPFVGVGSNQLITDETPTGLVNGANLNYTTAYAYTPGTMQVYINGVKQVRGTHFTEVGPGYTIFTTPEAPLTGDVISVNYQTTISTSGNADTVDGFNASSTPTANTLCPLNSSGKVPGTALTGSYSTSEINTGFTWVDGSAIYKKTIDFGALPNTTTKSVNHNITNLLYVINCEAFAHRASDSNRRFLPHTSPSAIANQFSISNVSDTQISVITAVDVSTYTVCYFTLYYTKTS